MSGGSGNTTISGPGPAWHMLWGNGNKWKSFQLDIVGFLAILGESAVVENAQVSALSRLFYLPRLLPAPQALLPPSRPTELPTEKAWVTGVYSGNNKQHIHHIARMLLGEEKTDKYSVRCIEVTKSEPKRPINSWDVFFRGVSSSNPGDKLAPPVKARATGPLTWVTLIGFSLAVCLFIVSIIYGDGFSLIATISLSLLSTLIGFTNKWELRFAKRAGPEPHPGDTVIRFPIGSFFVVKCTEEVARELFFAPEEIRYNIEDPVTSRLISLVGTLTLMLGIIFLANAKLQLQFAWAGAYVIINAAHWLAAAMPAGSHWDLSCYTVREQSLADGPENSNFTEALWKAIVLTKNTRWVQKNEAAPDTPAWNKWLKLAEEKANDAGYQTGPLVHAHPNRDWARQGKEAIVWNVPPWEAKAVWDRTQAELAAPASPTSPTGNGLPRGFGEA